MKEQLLRIEAQLRAQYPHWSGDKLRWMALQATGQLPNGRR